MNIRFALLRACAPGILAAPGERFDIRDFHDASAVHDRDGVPAD